ncbi:MAG TPA: ROK family protein [Stellaceae bacterium]|nr:ROK family protein [Stellaceae bacterium]
MAPLPRWTWFSWLSDQPCERIAAGTARGRMNRRRVEAGNARPAPRPFSARPLMAPLTLSVDIGGSNIKASVLDAKGRMIAPKLQVTTPPHPVPASLLRTIAMLARQLPPYDRVSAGFPGYVWRGRVCTAPNLGTDDWRNFPLAQALSRRLHRPARVLNDADVQGLGVIDGDGLECVLTFGTGVGSALFKDGRLLPHLELGQHPIWKRKTYDQYLGDKAFKRKGREHWNLRVKRAIAFVLTLTNCDTLHLGGGNASAIDFELPKNVRIASNAGGVTGGVKLWTKDLDEFFGSDPVKR